MPSRNYEHNVIENTDNEFYHLNIDESAEYLGLKLIKIFVVLENRQKYRLVIERLFKTNVCKSRCKENVLFRCSRPTQILSNWPNQIPSIFVIERSIFVKVWVSEEDKVVDLFEKCFDSFSLKNVDYGVCH